MSGIRRLEYADLSAALRLSEQAGWNQTLDDWRRFLDLQPDGCFVAVDGGCVIGTVTTCMFHRVAWIGMMLVDVQHRGSGIGSALMRQAMDHLSRQRVTSIRLDATPLGEPLYNKLGFVAQFRLTRFGGTAASLELATSARRLAANDIEALLDLDQAVIGYDRRRLVRSLVEAVQHAGQIVVDGDRVQGYVLARPGSLASYVGPCVAAPDCGEALLSAAFSQLQGRLVFADIPQSNRAAMAVAESAGLVPQRELLRMCLGDLVTERVECLWASSGPETG